MTNEEFMSMYEDSLRHGWVTSKIESIRKRQKEREKQYNREYYQQHSEKWKKKHSYIGLRATGNSTYYDPRAGAELTRTPTKITDASAEAIQAHEKRMREIDKKITDLQSSIDITKPVDAFKKGLELGELINEYGKVKKMRDGITRTKPSTLASQAQIESATRRRGIVTGMNNYKQNRSKLDAILDRADIVIESARRKSKKAISKVENIFKSLQPRDATQEFTGHTKQTGTSSMAKQYSKYTEWG